MARAPRRAWVLAWISAWLLAVAHPAIGADAKPGAAADLAVTDLREASEPGDGSSAVVYAVTLDNLGDAPAAKARLRIAVPPKADFVSVTPTKDCRLDAAARAIVCDYSDIPAHAAGKSALDAVRFSLKPADGGERSVAIAASIESQDDARFGNNSQAIVTTLERPGFIGVDLGVHALRPLAAEGLAADQFAMAVEVRNYGTLAAGDAQLRVEYPASLAFVKVLKGGACKAETPAADAAADAPRRLNCALGVLDPMARGEEALNPQLVFAAAKNATGAGSLVASVATGSGDAHADNDRRVFNFTFGADGVPGVAGLLLAAADSSGPATTAATDPSDTTAPADASSPTTTGDSGSGGTSTSGSVLFAGSVDASAPSGGNVDFLISHFETTPVEFPAGSTFTLDTIIENGGPGVSTNSSLDITLPTGVSFVSVTPSADCAYNSGSHHILCYFNDLAAAETRNIQAVLRAAEPGRVVKTFAAAIASNSNETNPANNSQTVNATIANGADLRLSATASPDPVAAGANLTYALTVDNIGLNIAEGARVEFNLPPGISYVSSGSGGSGWSCSASGQLVTCSSSANIAALTGTVSFNIVGHVSAGSGSYTASGTVYSLVTDDVDGSNDTTSVTVSVQPATDLAVSKLVSSNPVRGGTQPYFTIRVTNNGPISASNVVVTDTLPTGFTHVSAVGTGWSCGVASQTVTCTRGTMVVGSSDIVVTVNAPANVDIPEGGSTVINSATASSSTLDGVAGNNTGSVAFALRRDGADLSISMSRSPQPVAQGSSISNAITVRNNGPLAASGAYRVAYTLASGETYDTFSGTGWSYIGQAGNVVTFEHAGSLAVNANASVLTVTTTATSSGTLTSSACTSDDAGLPPVEGDLAPSNNCTSSNLTSTSAIADLIMGKTVSTPTVATGDSSFSYTLTVTNNGPNDAGDVRLTDVLNAYTAAYDDRPATTVTATPSQGTCSGTSTVSCLFGTINNGASASVTITLDRPLRDGTITNTASAYSWTVGDNNRANNSASVNVDINAVTDIKLRSVTVTPNPVKAGVDATFVITMRNNGWSAAAGVTLQSQFAGDYTFVSATPSKGSCSSFGSSVAGQLDCAIGSLANAEQQTVTVVLRPNHQASPPSPWQIVNTSSIATTTAETSLANNTGGVTLNVVPAEIDIDINDTDLVDPLPFNPGSTTDNFVTYRETITNYGPSYATGVHFTDKVTPPASGHRMKFVCDKAASGDSCTEATAGQICTGQGTITSGTSQMSIDCTVKKGAADEGEMAAGETYVRYLVYEVLDNPVAGGETFHKDPVVAANENDTVPSNDTTVELTTVRVRADMGVACSTPASPVSIREPFSYQLTVTNNGPGSSEITTLAQTLPTGLVLTSGPTPGSGGTCTGSAGSTSFSCALGTMASSATNVVTVPVRFTAYPSGGAYTYSASVTTNESDIVSSNNSCSAGGSVVVASIAGVVYRDDNDDAQPGAGEPGLSGVQVRLTGTDTYGNTVNTTVSTNSSGAYSFGNLSPADGSGYTVTEVAQPTTYADGQEQAGTGNTVAGSKTTDAIGTILLAAGEARTHYDFGELPTDIEVVSKTASASSVSLREPFDFTIVVRNNGPADATAATLTDNLPANMVLTGAPTTSVGSCTGTTGGSSVSCSFGTLANGGTVTVTVPVKITAAASYNNTATAATSRTEITTANNSKTTPVTATRSSIACEVYVDLDNDGVRGGSEIGIGGVSMRLTGTDAFGNGVDLTQSTGGDGSCLFDDLSPSDGTGYTLTETHPSAYLDGLENDHGSVVSGSNATDVIAGIPLGVDEARTPHQFGELPPTGISGTVYYDADNDGSIGAAETVRIENVTVTLTGTDDQGAVNLTTTTDANGFYSFTNLRPGSYTVTEAQPAGWLEGKASVGIGAATPGTADNAGSSASFGNVTSGIVMVADGTAVGYDFGELRSASLAGLVYNDTDSSDSRETGEPGIGGVTLTLTCTDHRGRAVNETTTTAADGTYAFTGLVPSDGSGCTLTETQPVGYQDGIDVAGSLGGTVGNDTVSAIVLAADDAGTGYDFAERSAGLSGHVYVDRNDNGVFDSGELPIAGVPVSLVGKDSFGADVNRTTTTAADGSYLFTGLMASDASGYTVSEAAQPAAWADGKDAVGSAGGSLANDQVSGISLANTTFATDYDFGELGGSLAGNVFTDLDNDGIHDGNEAGIPGVSLSLACTDVNGAPASNTATTDSAGAYLFEDVPATNAAGCIITETQPAGSVDGLDRVGDLGGTLGNDVLSAIPVEPGQHGHDYDFGEGLLDPASIAGHVWLDANHDRINDDNEPQTGWTVELVRRETPGDCSSSYIVVASTVTDANGGYLLEGLSPGVYDIRFRSANGGYVYGAGMSHGIGTDLVCGIGAITVAAGDEIVNQDLPLDPSGVVYDSLTRRPVSGATVAIEGPAGFDPDLHLVGGAGNVNQTTGTDGYYQFLLLSGAPAGTYHLVLGPPNGYIPQNSAYVPVCSNTLTVGSTPNPALIQANATAPALTAASHDAATCPVNSAGLASGAGSTQYYFDFSLDPGLPSANVVNNHLPVDPITEGALVVAKSTPKVDVMVGELVPYTITATNNIAATLPDIDLVDQVPPGFKYKKGSARIDGVHVEPLQEGRRLTWEGLSFDANATRKVTLMLVVGSGVSYGEYVNSTWAENGIVSQIASNVATAKVRVAPDPTFDCSAVIGKVFDDKNRNGYQDKGEPGLGGVRVATVRGLLVTTDPHGRFHVACAEIPDQDWGTSFIMKLDDRTLPTGYRVTTENPRVIRLTRGKMSKLNFGVAVHRVVRLDITGDAFTGKGTELKREWQGGIDRLVTVLGQGPSVLRIAYAREPGEDVRAVRDRIASIRRQVDTLWRRRSRAALDVESEIFVSARGAFK